MIEEEDLLSATGVAFAALAVLVERPEPIPKGELARLLTLLAETAAPDRPRQKQILLAWAKLLGTVPSADTH